MKTIIVVVAIVVLAALTRGCVGGCVSDYSDGSRTGVVTKFSRKGVFIKSWEGELVMGGAVAGTDGSVVANVFPFTVTDPAVVTAVQSAQEGARHVTLRYRQWLQGPIEMGTDYDVVEVKP